MYIYMISLWILQTSKRVNGNYTIILLMPATDKVEEITARTICSNRSIYIAFQKFVITSNTFRLIFQFIIGPKMNYI